MTFSHRLTSVNTDWDFYAYFLERPKMRFTILFEVNTKSLSRPVTQHHQRIERRDHAVAIDVRLLTSSAAGSHLKHNHSVCRCDHSVMIQIAAG